MEESGRRTKMSDGSLVTVIHSRPSQQQLADMSGTTRETVSRVLSNLQKKGFIAISGKDLIILQESELKIGVE
jgi:CRP/FNR family transcriptional regulator/CRP/FNR family cyclic AMP-dependent transcriptional regulator